MENIERKFKIGDLVSTKESPIITYEIKNICDDCYDSFLSDPEPHNCASFYASELRYATLAEAVEYLESIDILTISNDITRPSTAMYHIADVHPEQELKYIGMSEMSEPLLDFFSPTGDDLIGKNIEYLQSMSIVDLNVLHQAGYKHVIRQVSIDRELPISQDCQIIALLEFENPVYLGRNNDKNESFYVYQKERAQLIKSFIIKPNTESGSNDN